ncbi:Bug family tripartite tricarboxylate transporter substrate binding protein [Chenggangzhangella methanolivorans]|uniref:Tripartite tricarboxylate transporter substrate binding protein n=1 Tax=Chenggangzhangella methanolivorans TaxID=1437009 RepID=A0A9E6R651_9HYPH|nr:tripartite tricarboxylate transporter substrate binding protein [Chenggangzhangella methanolivorans]QZN98945.1 tripartite tricarboxylate transporter substrate binding protein [Chenggangzhangella methanolivorans]
MKITRRMATTGLCALAAALALPVPGFAQGFDRTVRIIVPYAPGGTSDTLARIFAPLLQEKIGQTVVVENKPGAAGNIGADAVAKADKDGQTYLLTDVGTVASAPGLFPDLSYKPLEDLAPVTMVMFSPYVLAVNPKLEGVTDVPSLLAYVKANPGKLAVANSGIGGVNHITAVAMAKELGIQWKTVPYKGGAAATQAVVSGESKLIINGATATLPFVTNGQLKGLAVTGEQRNAAAPDLPTFTEAKLPQADAGSWQGLMTTAGSPPDRVQAMNAAMNEILRRPEVVDRIKQQGGRVVGGSGEELGSWLKTNTERWGKVIADAGIKGQ